MLFLNDNKNHEWSYACLLTHTFAVEPEEITDQMRQTIERAVEVVSVSLHAIYVYKGAGDDDIDCFVMHTPGGYVLVLSSAVAGLNVETLGIIFAEADQDASMYGPEIEVDVPAAYSRVKKRAQDAGEPLAV